MLKKTPRSGFQFLGSGRESVADHSFRVAAIGYTLARMIDHPDPCKILCLCLFHDVPEARTGDLNYVNKRYVEKNEEQAIEDFTRALPFGDEVKEQLRELRENQTDDARLVHDADQLELILELKEQSDLGNAYADKWIAFALQRLQTEIGRSIATEILRTDSTDWWFKGNDHWWVKNYEE
jgi:putative hydrolase of HD superfamily